MLNTLQHSGTLQDGQVAEMVMEIGQKVRVRRLRDRVSQEVIKKLGAVGVVRQFKVVDGKGIGMLVQFDDKYSTWFFEDELEQYD
ncbi:cytochrome b6f subunit PetP [Leptolyngbya sp. NIES-2104]|uniref:cytochrome b6f subunit PetP n=1 Tax=Leptolyngbya sp. NIES-2104 TaxID=1552121 RepID=UPI0030DB6184